MKQRLQTRLRLFHAETWLEASVHTDPPMAAIQQVRESRPNGGSNRQSHKNRGGQTGFHSFKSRLGNADDRHGRAVDTNRAADHAGVARELRLPPAVAHNRVRMIAQRRIVIFGEQTACGRMDSKEVEIIAGHKLTADHFGFCSRVDARIDAVSTHHSSENLVAIANVLKHRVGQRILPHVASIVPSRAHQNHQPVRVLHREPAQDELVD